jgi:hypothetical protein
MQLIYLLICFCTFSYAVEESEALRISRVSCDKEKNPMSCYNYANFLHRAGDSSASDTYFEKGCKLDHKPSCDKELWEIKSVSTKTKVTEFVEDEKAMVKTETQIKDDSFEVKVSSTVSKEEANVTKSNRQDFNKALESCQSAKFEMKHPLMRGFTIVETIIGLENGKCKYTQTMPNDGLMSCAFDESQRQALAQDQNKMKEYGTNTDICEITGY